MKKQISKESISEALLKFARNKVIDESISISAEDKLMSIGIDSHNLLELIIFIEQSFGIKIPDHDLTIGNLSTIDSLANCAFENYKLANAG